MNFEKEFNTIERCGKDLNEVIKDLKGLKLSESDIIEIITFILRIETELWRARINIEYKLNRK